MCDKFDPCAAPLIHELNEILAVVTAEGTDADQTVRFRATNPTVKLHLTLEVYARPGNNGAGVSPAAHVYTDETWQLIAYAKDNPETALNSVFFDETVFPPVATPRPLPDSYEVESGIKVVRGEVVVQAEANPIGHIYKVVARWEPFDSNMSAEERKYWFAQCELKADGFDPVAVASAP